MCDLEDAKCEAEALLTKDSTVGGRNFHARAAVLIGASVLLAGGGVSWWRVQRLSVDGVIGESGCSDDGENCMATQCCNKAESTCFRKNDHWASCNATCTNNYKWEDDKWVNKGDEHVWDCHTLSCSDDGQNCMSSRCCSNEGSKCFKKNDHWASCNATCSQNYKWENNAWTDMGEKVWDCEELVPEQECDTSECDGCSGEQCQYCREEKERDCCLDEACRGAQGEQVALCRSDHLDKCCEGKTQHCKSGFDGDSPGGDNETNNETNSGDNSSGGDNGGGNSTCDTSECDGCSGEQCQYCREEKERDCCLDEACSGSQGEQVALCRSDNLDKCCEGKTQQCKSGFDGGDSSGGDNETNSGGNSSGGNSSGGNSSGGNSSDSE